MESVIPIAGGSQPPGQIALVNTYGITSRSEDVDCCKARAERFLMLQKIGKNLTGFRVGSCMKLLGHNSHGVRVYLREGRASYGGLAVCGSVWVCPVCSSKISECRCRELGLAIEKWLALGGQVLMISKTIPHRRGDSLLASLDLLSTVNQKTKRTRKWRTILPVLGLAGMIRALEVTYGDNGWHPHLHELAFFRPGSRVHPRTLQAMILVWWQNACASLGAPVPNTRGVDVRDGSFAQRYVTKWGLEHEMTKSQVKKGRTGNVSPMDLARDGQWRLFREYALATFGRKQLAWSRGLREILGVDAEKTDEEVASEVEPEDFIIAVLGVQAWTLVLERGWRALVLETAEKEGLEGIKRLLHEKGFDVHQLIRMTERL